MTALTTMFTFIYVYINYFVTIIFGGRFAWKDFSGEAAVIAKNIVNFFGAEYSIGYPGNPLLFLFLGIFVFGAIIGLVRRLIR